MPYRFHPGHRFEELKHVIPTHVTAHEVGILGSTCIRKSSHSAQKSCLFNKAWQKRLKIRAQDPLSTENEEEQGTDDHNVENREEGSEEARQDGREGTR